MKGALLVDTDILVDFLLGYGLEDALLAATAEVRQPELRTFNTKHYPMIKGIRPAYRK